MTHLFNSLAILACPLGMGLMMWMMMRSGKKSAPTATSPGETAKQAELDQLHAQIAEMRAGQDNQATSAPDLPTR